MTFENNYPQNPWSSVATKERTPWYYPELYREFRKRAIYNRFVGMSFNHNGPRATELVVTSLMQPHSNHDPIGVRDLWLDSAYQDTFARKVTFQRYAGKMSFNAYDELITYLQLDGVRGLKKIINEGLGTQMTNTLDKLARDAFFRVPFKLYGDGSGTWGGTGFNAIDADDVIKTQLLEDIRLGLKERGNPSFMRDDGGLGDAIVCITSPGVISDLRREASAGGNSAAFIDIAKYTRPDMIIRGEIGLYHGVRFVESNQAVLYNSGAIAQQKTITVPVAVGDGSPNPTTTTVDGVEYVGQAGAAHAITLSAVTGLVIGDMVSIHTDRSSAYGVTNGVDHTDGTLQYRRIVAISGLTISLDRPILYPFATDLGSGVYGYVTKGRHIHSALFLAGSNAVVMGTAKPPTIHTPLPIDDLEMIYRVSWDAYLGYVPFEKHDAEIVFLAGSNRITGARLL